MLKLNNNFVVALSERLLGVRSCTTKILPAEPSASDHLPVFEHPVKSAKSTSLYGWGLAQHGALGHYIQKRKKMKGITDSKYDRFMRPLRLHFGEIHNVKDIAAGYGFSAFSVKSKDQIKVYGTGLNTDSQIGFHSRRKNIPLVMLYAPVPIHLGLKQPTKTKVIAISAGRAHLVIATDLEGVFTLGNNAYGQCGRKIIQDELYTGSRVIHRIPHFKNDPVKSVECGQDHTLFLTNSGKVYSCGWGADGQTGLGHYNSECYPQRVLGDIENENIVKLSSKCDCVLAINDKGDVFGWGNSEYSQLFGEMDSIQQINRPIQLKKCEGFGKIVDVAAAGSYCIMLNEAGDVFSWGYGILGQGPNASHSYNPQIIPPPLFGRNEFQPNTRVKSIHTGLNHSAAINSEGDIYIWGKNREHCLGHNEKYDLFFPWRVCLGAQGKKLAMGVDHTLALCQPYG